MRMRSVQPSSPQPSDKVVIYGLVIKIELNGEIGKVVENLPLRQRVSVELSSGERYCIKPSNLAVFKSPEYAAKAAAFLRVKLAADQKAEKAATALQAEIRAAHARAAYGRVRAAARVLQGAWRDRRARCRVVAAVAIQRCERGQQQRVRAARPEDGGATSPAKAAVAAVGAAWASLTVGVSLFAAAAVATLLVIWVTAAAGLVAKTEQPQVPRASTPAASARRHFPRHRYGSETKYKTPEDRFSFVASTKIMAHPRLMFIEVLAL